jgi:hypothetical protein
MTARPDRLDHATVLLPRDQTVRDQTVLVPSKPGHPNFPNRGKYDGGFRMPFHHAEPEITSRLDGIAAL